MPELTLSDGSALHYQRIAGDADKPTLVFLHEGLGCIALWRGFPEQLCKASGCPGLIYDRQGYGRSAALSRPRSIHYMHAYALDELPAVLDQLITDQSYILVGHSDGGSIALIHAAEKPPGLLGLITEAAHVFVEDITLAGIRVAQQAWNDGKLTGLAKYHGDQTAAIFHAWSDTWLSPWFRPWNIEYLLASIDVPLLALQGKDDQYGSPKQLDNIIEQTAGESKAQLIADCAHTPHAEQPQTVTGLMQEFIAATIDSSIEQGIERKTHPKP